MAIVIFNLQDILDGLDGRKLSRRRRKSFGYSISDKRKRNFTPQETKQHDRFKAAVAYAKSINNDPQKKAAYAKSKKLKKGTSVYLAAMKKFLKGKVPASE